MRTTVALRECQDQSAGRVQRLSLSARHLHVVADARSLHRPDRTRPATAGRSLRPFPGMDPAHSHRLIRSPFAYTITKLSHRPHRLSPPRTHKQSTWWRPLGGRDQSQIGANHPTSIRSPGFKSADLAPSGTDSARGTGGPWRRSKAVHAARPNLPQAYPGEDATLDASPGPVVGPMAARGRTAQATDPRHLRSNLDLAGSPTTPPFLRRATSRAALPRTTPSPEARHRQPAVWCEGRNAVQTSRRRPAPLVRASPLRAGYRPPPPSRPIKLGLLSAAVLSYQHGPVRTT